MSRIEKSIDVDVPVRAAYDQWTQCEEFPKFMDGVASVSQIDDKNLHWRARVAGRAVEWNAEIVEQVPDRRIAWRSTSGAHNQGVVAFQVLAPDRTRVTLALDVDPRTFAERLGDTLGAVDMRIRGDLERFKRFIEGRQQPTGAWRGEIHGAL